MCVWRKHNFSAQVPVQIQFRHPNRFESDVSVSICFFLTRTSTTMRCGSIDTFRPVWSITKKNRGAQNPNDKATPQNDRCTNKAPKCSLGHPPPSQCVLRVRNGLGRKPVNQRIFALIACPLSIVLVEEPKIIKQYQLRLGYCEPPFLTVFVYIDLECASPLS